MPSPLDLRPEDIKKTNLLVTGSCEIKETSRLSNMPPRLHSLSRTSRLAAVIRARGFLAPSACIHCVETAQLCYISSSSVRCAQCVSDHRECSHSNNIDCLLFSFDIQQVDQSIVEAERALDESFVNLESSHQQMLSCLNYAYQAFVSVQLCLSRIHELRAQRSHLTPTVAPSAQTRCVLSCS